jgi:hypothetical protein
MPHNYNAKFILWKEFKQEKIISNLSLIIIVMALYILLPTHKNIYNSFILLLMSYSIIFSQEIFLNDLGKNYFEALLASPYSLEQILMKKTKYIAIKTCIFTIISIGFLITAYPTLYIKGFHFYYTFEFMIMLIFIYCLICINGFVIYKYSKFVDIIFDSIILFGINSLMGNIYNLILFQIIVIVIEVLSLVNKMFKLKNEKLIVRLKL